MKPRGVSAAVAVAFMWFGVTASLPAGEVTVKGVHLCCDGCVSAVEDAMEMAKAVTSLECDVNAKTVSFSVPDEKAGKAAVQALAKGGFFGKAIHDGKELPFPDNGARKGAKSDTVTITGMHLCCDACVNGAQKALEKVDRLTTTEFDRAKGTVRLIGQQIEAKHVLILLNKAGFYGRVGTKKKRQPSDGRGRR